VWCVWCMCEAGRGKVVCYRWEGRVAWGQQVGGGGGGEGGGEGRLGRLVCHGCRGAAVYTAEMPAVYERVKAVRRHEGSACALPLPPLAALNGQRRLAVTRARRSGRHAARRRQKWLHAVERYADSRKQCAPHCWRYGEAGR